MTGRTTHLRDRLASETPELRRRAAQEIPSLPAPDSCDLLLVALGDEDWRVRKEAATVATRVEPRTAVVFALARALSERENIGLRNAAVEALVLIGPDAVPGAIDALERLDADGRKLAVEVLSGAPTLAGMRALSRLTEREADPNVRVAATEGLGQAHLAGEEARELAVSALERALGAPAPFVQLAALESLGRLAAQVSWNHLEALMLDPLLRRSAIAAAAGSRAPRTVRALAEACADESASSGREAVLALGRSIEEAWGDDSLLDVAAKTLRALPVAHERLRTLARDEDETVRGAAVLALGLVRDPDDVSLLADAMGDVAVADRAEAALHLFGQDAIGPLLAAGKTAAPSLRGAAISMLPQLAPRQTSPLAAVREALDDTSPEVVASALKSLAIVGGADDLPRVAQDVTSSSPKVAGAAQAALAAIATRHPKEARSLTEAADPRGESALAAVLVRDAVARTGLSEPNDSTFLASALTHRDARVRRAALDALASIGGDEASQAVTLSLADEEDAVAQAAIRALGRLGRGDQLASLAASTRDPLRLASILRALGEADPQRAFAAAQPLLRSPEGAVAAAAVEVASATGNAARIEALMDACGHADQEVVKLALTKLAKTGDERALVALGRAIEHPSEVVRRSAAELLGSAGSEAQELLRARLDRERSADVRRAIMQALSTRTTEEPA